MDFAKKQLEKYGWREGDGLGKHKGGISKAIKPKLKFDNAGLGHSLTDEIINPWWARVFDDAVGKIAVKNEEGDVIIETDNNSENTKKTKRKKEKYNNFIKKSRLSGNGETLLNNEDDIEEMEKPKLKGAICDMNDEELFKACGGRTGHKGARHGINMSAKLARLADQETELYNQIIGKVPKKKKKKSK